MNISYNWLKRYIPLAMEPSAVADALTSVGLETGSVEERESIRGGLRGLVIGKVLTCEAHPDSDHLHITTVDLGGEAPVQIVCGAPNVAAGQTVVVATVGTTLYDGDKEFKIKKSKIRGVESLGMICAEDEIGVGTSHDGIIVIEGENKPAPGTPAAEYFGLSSDWVFEVDLTPNRIDAASHFGVARDLAAWSTANAEPMCASLPEGTAADQPLEADCAEGAVSVSVEDTEACPRYCGVTIRGVKVTESPKWLRDLLTAIGQRPINNVVDITNFILLGMGQPLHAFDLAKVKGEAIVVRHCPQDTPFVTLDGVERKLDSRDLMICNAEEPMCIAGVFGGLGSGVTDSTTDIFLESAWFNPTSVRKTARRHGLNTDASFRYERGADPSAPMCALRVAARLIQQLAGGKICGEPVDIYPVPVEPARVDLDLDAMDALIGKSIPEDKVRTILGSLDIAIDSAEGRVLHLTIPTYRVDVTRPCDVTEEVLRIYGYNNVETGTRLNASLTLPGHADAVRALRNRVADRLAGRGFNEIMNNSLTSASYYEENEQYPIEGCVRLLNPLSNDLSVMRRTLLYGVLETVSHNLNRREDNLMVYEFGNVYHFDPQAHCTDDAPLRPYSQNSRLGIAVTGELAEASWLRPASEATVYDLRAIVSDILLHTGVNGAELVWNVGTRPVHGPCLVLSTRSGKELGTVGPVAPALLKRFDIKQPVLYAELDWDELCRMAMRRNITYTPIPRTQPVRRDLALLIDTSVTLDSIVAAVRKAERKLLRDVQLFDVYEGPNLPEGKKSYAIAITLQDPEKTLTDAQIERSMANIEQAIVRETGAVRR